MADQVNAEKSATAHTANAGAAEAKAETTASAGQEVQKKRAQQKPKKKAARKDKMVLSSSKRKEARARAVVKKGTGRIIINSVNADLIEPREFRSLMLEPLNISNIAKELSKGVDIEVNVQGGGRSAQAQAVRSAIAKGISEYAESDTIRKEYLHYDRSLLVDDPRRVEPKKFKGPKARARFQTSYR